jgi:hypothetical protein
MINTNPQPLRALIKSHVQARESRRIRQHHAVVFAAPRRIGYRRIGKTEIKNATFATRPPGKTVMCSTETGANPFTG